jgi:hypothetical protein
MNRRPTGRQRRESSVLPMTGLNVTAVHLRC